jgi:dTDP-4-dehydrorhamnose 3,5-epimerase
VIVRRTPLEGVVVIEPEPDFDERGSFARLWCSEEFSREGLQATFVQSSISRNARRFTVRGLHYAVAPSTEAKLVFAVTGRLFDVVVDLREDSPTHGRAVTLELDARSPRPLAVYVPPQCAHGFQTLEDDTTVLYCMTQAYRRDWARALHWRSPALAIAWPHTGEVVISRADREAPAQLPALCAR